MADKAEKKVAEKPTTLRQDLMNAIKGALGISGTADKMKNMTVTHTSCVASVSCPKWNLCNGKENLRPSSPNLAHSLIASVDCVFSTLNCSYQRAKQGKQTL